MLEPIVSAAQVRDLLVHLGRVGTGGDTGSRLTAAQWTCLRFLDRANEVTRTPSSFARFQATSRGTATQTIKSLVALGLVRRRKASEDGRRVHLDLTAEGHAALAADPLADLDLALEAMGPAERHVLASHLLRIGCAMADARGEAAFGHCRACRHFDRTGNRHHCRDRQEDIPAPDTERLCDRFSADPAQLR